MEFEDKITLEASGEFPFKFFIEKAVTVEDDKEFILEGIASTTNLDHDSERMSESALRSMEAAINDFGVPLRVEHQKEDMAIIGKVYKAWVDERNQLHVKARLDKSHPASTILYNSMKTGAKMGLSVGGLVKHAVRELSEKTGKMVKTFYDVALKEVSVTPRPANYDSWLVAKSITEKEDDGERFRDSAIYREFLFENPQLDYLQAFAKSIPDVAWHKVASQDTKTTMDTEETKKDSEKTDTTEKAVSRGEFNTLSSLVAKGFENMNSMLAKALHVEAHDQEAPGKDKPEQIGNEIITAKTEADGTDVNGTREKSETETEKEKAADDAKDEANPNKAKPKEIGDEAATAKAEDTTDEYKLETVERAIKSMEATQARLTKMTETETDTKTKSETETDKEKAEDSQDETTKGMHPIDILAGTISKTLEAIVDKMEKSGKSIPGFEKHFINTLREDPLLQEEIAKMIKIPGLKKSVSMGVPYVATKDGRRFSIASMSEVGIPTIEKSQGEGKPKTFKELYKTDYSSIKPAE